MNRIHVPKDVLAAEIRAGRVTVGGSGAYQAVYVSHVDLEFSGAAKGFRLAFANPTYADRFMTLNRGLGLTTK